jgi:putative tricarboxylic transport membrane protein
LTDDNQPGAGDDGRRGAIKSPQDFAAGLFILALAAFAYFAAYKLKFGQLRGIGPGLMPQVTALLVATFGLLLIVQSFISKGSVLDRWSIRGPFFVLGGVLLFALTIRGADLFGIKFPALGLLVAGPLATIFCSFADKDTKWWEILLFATVITAFCIGLFKFALRLPIPLAPWWLGY